MRMEHDPYFDISVLNTLLEGDRQMMRRFAARFIETARSALAEIDSALAAGDLPQLRHLGHRTRSGALTVGAGAIAALCKQLELLPDGPGPAQALVDELHAALAATAARMNEAGLT
jgi:HPt (histidine-containing phosphotransfer) domain-containing protein